MVHNSAEIPLDGEILGPEENRERNVKSRFFRTLKKAARQIPFMDELVAAYYCAFDKKTPKAVRASLLAALAYFVLPTDIIPDFILGIGFGDDITVLATTIALVRSHITDEHLLAAKQKLADIEKL
ncbi:MAG: YkvA family protein [Stappiaceae bacterium]